METTKPDRSVKILLDEPPANGAVIKVIGVGGGGTNAVNRMIDAGVEAVEFIVANTDMQALKSSRAPTKLQIGAKLTNGLGAGADPHVGRSAALEDTDRIIEVLEGADMIFVAAGLGGGTGTGAAPIIANLAAELGALTVAIVTEPFLFEGKKRRVQAERGLQDLRACVDTLIAISNERLLQTMERGTSFSRAFEVADDILRQGVQGISDIIQVPGIINVDFADVKAVMQGMGRALMGTGTARGKDRASEAANRAIASPLLENVSIQGAKGILINITGSEKLLLHEVSESASIIHEAADEDANIIFGAVIDDNMTEDVKITVIATGFDNNGAGAAFQSAVGDSVDRDDSSGLSPDSPAAEPEAVTVPESGFPPGQSRLYDPRDLEVPAYLRRKLDE